MLSHPSSPRRNCHDPKVFPPPTAAAPSCFPIRPLMLRIPESGEGGRVRVPPRVRSQRSSFYRSAAPGNGGRRIRSNQQTNSSPTTKTMRTRTRRYSLSLRRLIDRPTPPPSSEHLHRPGREEDRRGGDRNQGAHPPRVRQSPDQAVVIRVGLGRRRRPVVGRSILLGPSRRPPARVDIRRRGRYRDLFDKVAHHPILIGSGTLDAQGAEFLADPADDPRTSAGDGRCYRRPLISFRGSSGRNRDEGGGGGGGDRRQKKK